MVQIEGYLKEVEHLLLYSAELNLKTTKLLVNSLYEHLSPKEQARNKQNVDRILIIGKQQLSLVQQQSLEFLNQLLKRLWKSLDTDLYDISQDDLLKLEKIRGIIK